MEEERRDGAKTKTTEFDDMSVKKEKKLTLERGMMDYHLGLMMDHM